MLIMATQNSAYEHFGAIAGSRGKLHPEIQVKKTGLVFSRSPSLSSWEAIGRQLLSIADSSTWWIADWLAYGERAFKDRYVEAITRTNLNYQTLRNYAWVARRFDQSRRREELSFGHHAEVAALDVHEQDYWLRKAVELGWSRNHLRVEVRASIRERKEQAAQTHEADENAASGPDDIEPCSRGKEAFREPGCDAVRLVLTREQITLFESVASAWNMELHEWVVQVLEAVAGDSSTQSLPVSPAGHVRISRSLQPGSRKALFGAPPSLRHFTLVVTAPSPPECPRLPPQRRDLRRPPTSKSAPRGPGGRSARWRPGSRPATRSSARPYATRPCGQISGWGSSPRLLEVVFPIDTMWD